MLWTSLQLWSCDLSIYCVSPARFYILHLSISIYALYGERERDRGERERKKERKKERRKRKEKERKGKKERKREIASERERGWRRRGAKKEGPGAKQRVIHLQPLTGASWRLCPGRSSSNLLAALCLTRTCLQFTIWSSGSKPPPVMGQNHGSPKTVWQGPEQITWTKMAPGWGWWHTCSTTSSAIPVLQVWQRGCILSFRTASRAWLSKHARIVANR